jgi:FkbM family methyltransferase
MDRLHSEFIRPGELVFDVGAHVGDRIASFRRLGARVVAVEPQHAMAGVLRLLYGFSRSVAIEEVAVGREPGRARMMINADNPTVSTFSSAFVDAARGAPGWETQRWTGAAEVAVTTLDALMTRHGRPAFIKLDVEGFCWECRVPCLRCPSSLQRFSGRSLLPASSVAPPWATPASMPRLGKAKPL